MDEDAEFNKFWEYYPSRKKKSKGDAYKAWNQVRAKRPALATVLKALVVLKESDDWMKDNGQYIPLPATWLRAWGWADVGEEEKKDIRGDQMWWKTVSGVEAKAKELGIEWDAINGETFVQFRDRVRVESEAKKIAPIKAANG